MRSWVPIVAALILAAGIVLHGLLPRLYPRYEVVSNSMVVDRWHGITCRVRDVGTERCPF